MQFCDDKKPSKYITYLDANNLYGSTISQYLPYGKFKWLNQKEIDKFDVKAIEKNGSNGQILKGNLEYSDELHELHNDYPLVLEKLEISNDMLSKYCSDIANKYGIKVGGVHKLVPNLGNKSKYVLHYQNLQLYLSFRIKLVSAHRILKFNQSDWMKTYIDFNTKKEKTLLIVLKKKKKKAFKLIINSVYGKQRKI